MFLKRKYIGEYRLGRTIGQGAFSKVKLGYHRTTGEQVAIKIAQKPAPGSDDERKQFGQRSGDKFASVSGGSKQATSAGAGIDKTSNRTNGSPKPASIVPFVVVEPPATQESQPSHKGEAVSENELGPIIMTPYAEGNSKAGSRQTMHSSGASGSGEPFGDLSKTVLREADEIDDHPLRPRSVSAQQPITNPLIVDDQKVAILQTLVSAEKAEPPKEDVPEYIRHLSLEVQLLMRLNHPNIIKLFQLFETPNEFYLIMEFAAGGEMIDYIVAKGHLSEKEARKYFRQLISALDHFHEAGVVHRDIKLENLLLSKDKNLLISDFGLGRTFVGRRHLLGTFCGTPLYASPEIVSGQKYIGPPSDIWSTGAVLYIMITGSPPFRADNLAELYRKIKGIEYDVLPTFSPELIDLFSKIFVRDPSRRITIDQLRLHPWVNLEEVDLPLRIRPRFVNDEQSNLSPDKKYGALISGITHDAGDMIVYNFGNHHSQISRAVPPPSQQPHAQAMPPFGSSVPVTRRSSIATSALMPFSNDRRNSITVPPPVETSNPHRRGSLNVPKLAPFRLRAPSDGSPANNNSVLYEVAAPQIANIRRSSSATYEAAVAAAAATALAAAELKSSRSPKTNASGNGVEDNLMPLKSTFKRPSLGGHRRLSIQVPMATSSPQGPSSAPPGTSSNTAAILSPINPPPLSADAANGDWSFRQRRFTLQPGDDAVKVLQAPAAAALKESGTTDSDSDTASKYSQIVSLQSHYHASSVSTVPTRRSSDVDGDGNTTTSSSSRRASKTHAPIRSVRFSFTNTTTTSKRSPDELVDQIQVILQQQAIEYELLSEYVFECRHISNIGEELVFEIEICKVWLLKLVGVKIKRLSGNVFVYKSIYERIVGALNLD